MYFKIIWLHLKHQIYSLTNKILNMVLPFQEFRKIKDSLPHGSIEVIAKELGIEAETVRNYFGGTDFGRGKVSGVHFEKGPNGGFVRIDNPDILNCALRLLNQNHN